MAVHYKQMKPKNGKLVKTTNIYRYMGLLFTHKPSRSATNYKMVAQTRKAIYSSKFYQHAFGFFPLNEYFKIFLMPPHR